MRKRLLERLKANIQFHLDHGYTRIELEDPNSHWDIPTCSIPRHLRKIGSIILVSTESLYPDPEDTATQMRAAQWILVEDDL
jgi:hypothetical protein